MTWLTGRRNIAAVISAVLLASVAPAQAGAEPERRPTFEDVKARAIEFIGWSKSIRLTAMQEKTKHAALGSIPAPCCKDYSIATCCCPCNLAKSVWGLANYAIARLDYDAAQTRALTLEWLQATNPRGYTGDSCYRGGCPKRFAANGCGGMKDDAVVF